MARVRRDARREAADAVARTWQIYADQIGIPDRPSFASDEPLTAPREPPTRRWPHVALVAKAVVGTTLAAVAVTVIVSIGDRSTSRVSLRAPAPPAAPPPAERPVVPAMNTASTSSVPVPLPADTGRTVAAETNDARTPVVYQVNFEFASDYIDGHSKRTLERVIAALKANPDSRVTIEGHTDAQGTPEYNLALSERRAHAVRAHLEAAGIAAERLTAVGHGASRPVAPHNGARSFLNRRVELHRR